MPKEHELLCLRANAPQFDPAKGAEGLPQRILVLPWGEQDTAQGKVICDDTTMRLLAGYNASKNWDRIALDFEHSSVPSSPTYKGEPVKVAGYGKLQLVPNEGVYLLMSSWTAEGKEFAAGGHYGDLSPVVKCNKANEVIGLHSVALCRHGATPGLVFLSAAAAVQHGGLTTAHPSKSTKTMTPEEFQKALAKALGLPDAASAEEILAAFTKSIEAKDEKDDAAMMGESKMLSAGLDEIKTLLKAQDAKITAQDEKLKLLSSGIDTNERASILKQAATEGKQVPATAAKTMNVADLKLLCAELPVTVPMDKRTPDGTTLLLSSSTPAVNSELAAIDKLTGISDDDVKKYAAK